MAEELVVKASLRDELSAPLQKARREVEGLGTSAAKAEAGLGRMSGGFDKAAAGSSRLTRAAAGIRSMAPALDSVHSAATRMAGGFDKAVGAAVKMGGIGANALGHLATAAGVAVGGAVTLGVRTAAEMQNASVAFTTMLGSAQKAGAFLGQLKTFAAQTPFEFPELQTAASSLVSAGVEASKVIPIMTTLGNVTSGMGTGSEGVQRATVAIQQMNAAGKITGEDLNQLRDAGIPVYDLLASATGKSKAEVVALAQAGKLGSKELGQMMAALESGKGMERFAGLMEAQSKTLGGAFSTLSDNVKMGLAGAIEPLTPMLTSALGAVANFVGQATPALSGFSTKLASMDVAGAIQDWFKLGDSQGIAEILDNLLGNSGDYVEPIRSAFDGIRQAITDVSTIVTSGLVPAWNNMSAILPSWSTPLGLAQTALGLLADHANVIAVALPLLTAAMTGAKVATVAWQVATMANNAVQAIKLAMLMAQTPGTLAFAVAQGVGTAATIAQTVATWALNAALAVLTSPITAIIAVVALLVAGIYLAYTRCETFRNAVNAVGGAIMTAVGKVGQFIGFLGRLIGMAVVAYFNGIKAVLGTVGTALQSAGRWVSDLWSKFSNSSAAQGALNGIKGAVDALGSALNWLRDKAAAAWDKLTSLSHISLPSLPFGDTATAHGRGHGAGRAAQTLAGLGAAAKVSGTRPTVSNMFVGGAGYGRGSGDHQAGRAVDLVGSGLPSLASAIRGMGGFAEFHGSGPTRHLHAVPAPIGDTATSKARVVRPTTASGAGTVMQVSVSIDARGASRDVDVERAVQRAMERVRRDTEERA